MNTGPAYAKLPSIAIISQRAGDRGRGGDVPLDQNIAGEPRAITTYTGLMDITKDMVTHNRALAIVEQEVEHEEDLRRRQESTGDATASGLTPVSYDHFNPSRNASASFTRAAFRSRDQADRVR